jgi:regulator of replication initiation timing
MELQRSNSMKIFHSNNVATSNLEIELGETKKKISEISESLKSNERDIKKLELENQDIKERSPIFVKQLKLLEEKLN